MTRRFLAKGMEECYLWQLVAKSKRRVEALPEGPKEGYLDTSQRADGWEDTEYCLKGLKRLQSLKEELRKQSEQLTTKEYADYERLMLEGPLRAVEN